MDSGAERHVPVLLAIEENLVWRRTMRIVSDLTHS
jgi:hypothetical protein